MYVKYKLQDSIRKLKSDHRHITRTQINVWLLRFQVWRWAKLHWLCCMQNPFNSPNRQPCVPHGSAIRMPASTGNQGKHYYHWWVTSSWVLFTYDPKAKLWWRTVNEMNEEIRPQANYCNTSYFHSVAKGQRTFSYFHIKNPIGINSKVIKRENITAK